MASAFPHRHGRACPGHPRLYRSESKTWMPGTRPGMTSSWNDLAKNREDQGGAQ